MRPEHALDDWRDWDAGLRARPDIIGKLDGGRSNHGFLLNADIGKLVLRINGSDTFLPGNDRSFEPLIWQAASRNGIAPPLVFVDGHNRYLVSRHIESRLPTRPHTDKAVVDQALGLLDRCHRMNVDAPAIDYAGHIERYWRMIESGPRPPGQTLERQRKPMRALLTALADSGTPTGLCHHDPVIENFVGTRDRLYLIDWEYAATGLQIMDYAALAAEWQIDDQTMLARTGFNPEHLEMARALYTYTCALWEEATA